MIEPKSNSHSHSSCITSRVQGRHYDTPNDKTEVENGTSYSEIRKLPNLRPIRVLRDRKCQSALVGINALQGAKKAIWSPTGREKPQCDSSKTAEPVPLVSWSQHDCWAAKSSHLWTVKYFAYCKVKNRGFIKSQPFSTGFGGDSDTLQWALKCFPRGRNKDSEGFFSLYLVLDDAKNTAVRVKVEMSVLDEFGHKQTKGTLEDTQYIGRNKEEWGWGKFMTRGDLVRYNCLSNSHLLILCEIELLEAKPTHSVKSLQVYRSKSVLAEDLGRLFEKPIYGDCVIRVGRKEFKVHRGILAARSAVFAAMLANGTKGRDKVQRLTMRDIDHEVAGEVFYFLYTGKAPNVEKMAPKLLSAADRLQINDLKSICESVLVRKVTASNAPESPKLAQQNGAQNLKEKSVAFLAKNPGCAAVDFADRPLPKVYDLFRKSHNNSTDTVNHHYEKPVIQQGNLTYFGNFERDLSVAELHFVPERMNSTLGNDPDYEALSLASSCSHYDSIFEFSDSGNETNETETCSLCGEPKYSRSCAAVLHPTQ